MNSDEEIVKLMAEMDLSTRTVTLYEDMQFLPGSTYDMNDMIRKVEARQKEITKKISESAELTAALLRMINPGVTKR